GQTLQFRASLGGRDHCLEFLLPLGKGLLLSHRVFLAKQSTIRGQCSPRPRTSTRPEIRAVEVLGTRAFVKGVALSASRRIRGRENTSSSACLMSASGEDAHPREVGIRNGEQHLYPSRPAPGNNPGHTLSGGGVSTSHARLLGRG